MTDHEKQSLKLLYNRMAAYYGQTISDDVLRMYAEDLADLPFARASQAMGELRRDPKISRCPLPSQVRARCTPESSPEGEALLVVGRIVESIARIGPHRAAEAKEAIGPVGWAVVKMSGGWEHVCTLETPTMGTHQAQWRSLAKTLIERGFVESTEFQIEHKPSTEPALASIGKVLELAMPKKEGVL